MESMEACNARRLSNGMTRLEYYRSLNRDFTQEPRVYYGAFEKRVDIAYAAASARQKYDVYMPLNPGRYPTIVWIHGGGWFMGDRSDFAMGYLLPFIAHGYTVVSIGYRLAEEAVFPEPVYDVLEGLKHVLQRAEEFRIDRERICLMSGSAGTTLAALAALWNPEPISAVILRCPILDFTGMRKQFEQLGIRRTRFPYPDEDTSIEALFLGGSTLERPEAAAAANPAGYLDQRCPRFLLIHGLEDEDTPYLQSVEFAGMIREKSGDLHRAQVELLPETGHDNGRFDDPSTFELELRFLRESL